MIKKIINILFFLVSVIALNGQTSLSGFVKDSNSEEPVLFAVIILEQQGEFIWAAQTGFEGEFKMTQIEAGVYDLVVINSGYDTLRVADVLIQENEETEMNFELKLLGIYRTIPEDIVVGAVNEEELIIRSPVWSGNADYYLMHLEVNELNPIALRPLENGGYEIDCFQKIRRVRLTDVEGKTVRQWFRLKAGKTKLDLDELDSGNYYLKTRKRNKEVEKAIFWID